MRIFQLGHFSKVDLCDLLKLEGLTESGAQAKAAIEVGEVLVDGLVETRKRCKVYPGQQVQYAGETILVKN